MRTVIRGISLKPSDGNGALSFVEDTCALTQLFDGADPRTGSSEEVRLENRLGRTSYVPGIDLLNESRNVYVRGARLHARRIRAI